MKKKTYTLQIEVTTGLHIGMGGDKAQIGGIDSPVIKDPITQLPYIPGSSIKGKLRCLLETEGGYGEMNDEINTIFGPTSDFLEKNKKYIQTPTRLIFRDIFIKGDQKLKFERGEMQTETKTEIRIDRRTGTVAGGALWTVERIPPGTIFTGDIIVRYYGKEEEELKKISDMLDEAVKLLNNDYLGGSGSRGYGAVKAKIFPKSKTENENDQT